MEAHSSCLRAMASGKGVGESAGELGIVEGGYLKYRLSGHTEPHFGAHGGRCPRQLWRGCCLRSLRNFDPREKTPRHPKSLSLYKGRPWVLQT